MRYKNAQYLKKYLAEENSKKIKFHTIAFFILMIYSAIIWNIGAIYMAYAAPSPYEYVGFIAIFGLITVGTLSLLPIFAAYMIYSFMLISPQIIIFYNYHTDIHQGVLLLCLIYMPVIYITSKSINHNSINSIQNEEQLKKISITDSLTNIYNRGFFIEYSEKFLNTSISKNNDLSLLMLDLDHFKAINDNFGHQCGDYVLAEFSNIIKNNLRKNDLFARMGGEEFGILLLNTSIKESIVIAQKICDLIKQNKFIYENQIINLTVSIGVSQKDNDLISFESLYKKADSNLYTAKNSGRNQVIAAM